MFFIIPIVVMVLVCLLAAIVTEQGTRMGPDFTPNPVIDGFSSPALLGGLCLILSEILPPVGSRALSLCLIGLYSLLWGLMIPDSSAAVLAFLAVAIKAHISIFLSVKVAYGLGLALMGAIWAGTNFSIHFYLENKTPLDAVALCCHAKRTRQGVRFDNSTWAFIEQLFSLRDRDIIAQMGEPSQIWSYSE